MSLCLVSLGDSPHTPSSTFIVRWFRVRRPCSIPVMKPACPALFAAGLLAMPLVADAQVFAITGGRSYGAVSNNGGVLGNYTSRSFTLLAGSGF